MSTRRAGALHMVRRAGWWLACTAAAFQIGATIVVAADQVTGYEVLAVDGNSMEPAFSLGDAIVIDTNATPTVGDVITFRAPGDGTVVTHRVISTGGDAYRTKGDANDNEDFSSVPEANVMGVVHSHVSNAGYLLLWLFTGWGKLLTYGPLLVLIALNEATKCYRLLKEEKATGRRRADTATMGEGAPVEAAPALAVT